MGLMLGNTLGLWALLGIPAVLLIHFIQQRFRKANVSTLFLLERLDPTESHGRSFRMIRSSVQLWLQLLAVLLLTFLLSDPQRVIQLPIQRVVVVLDSSFSMHAALPELQKALPEHLRGVERGAHSTEWLLYETNLAKGRMYRGKELGKLLERIARWTPVTPSHDASVSLREISDVVGRQASYYFITDHLQTVPESYSVLSFGSAIPNWGIIGMRLTEQEDGSVSFDALLRNYSPVKGTKTWWVESAGTKGSGGEVTLDARAFTTLHGFFPEGVDELVVRVDGDAYELDDALPLRRPVPRQLKVYAERGDLSQPFRRLLSSLHSAERVNVATDSDLRLNTLGGMGSDGGGFGAVFFAGSDSHSETAPGQAIAESSTLTDGLRFESLIPGPVGNLPVRPEDDIVLWLKDRPLVFLREDAEGARLFVNFDIRYGNALQHPAFIILFNRYCERARRMATGAFAGNFELNQRIPGVDNARIAEGRIRPAIASAFNERTETYGAGNVFERAPARASFFTLSTGNAPLVQGATYYADSRESDFAGFSSFATTAKIQPTGESSDDSSELFFPLWVCLLLALVLGSWVSDRFSIRAGAHANVERRQ